MKYIIFLFTFFSSLLFSQWPGSSGAGKQMPAIGILSGTIIDSSTTEPLEYASISLINTRSKQLVTGGLSDEKGNFYIKEIPLGPYMAVIEFVGYKKKEIKIPQLKKIVVWTNLFLTSSNVLDFSSKYIILIILR